MFGYLVIKLYNPPAPFFTPPYAPRPTPKEGVKYPYEPFSKKKFSKFFIPKFRTPILRTPSVEWLFPSWCKTHFQNTKHLFFRNHFSKKNFPNFLFRNIGLLTDILLRHTVVIFVVIRCLQLLVYCKQTIYM
jgi:hypothetical protein